MGYKCWLERYIYIRKLSKKKQRKLSTYLLFKTEGKLYVSVRNSKVLGVFITFLVHDFIAIIESCWILVISGKENKVRVTRMIIIVIAIFAVCWFPTQLILLLKGIFLSSQKIFAVASFYILIGLIKNHEHPGQQLLIFE